MSANVIEKSNDTFFAVTVEDILNDESDIDDDADWMSTSVVMQVSKLKEEWNLEAKEKQALIDVYDISKYKITIDQIQGSLISTQVKIFDSDICYHISSYYNGFSYISDISS